ncbi:MAG: HDIG domain-containing protein [Magnetococcus sp. WYHC-3]
MWQNPVETDKRREAAAAAVEQVYFRAKKGEIIAREGEVISESTHRKLMELGRNSGETDKTLLRVLGMATVLALLLIWARRFLLRTYTIFPRDRRSQYILGAILLIVAFASTLVHMVGLGMAEMFNWRLDMVAYLPPVALGAALTSLIIGARVSLPGGSLVVGTLLSFLTAMTTGGGLPVFVLYLLGSLVGAVSLRTCRNRFDVLRAGTWIGVFQALAVPCVELMAGQPLGWEMLDGVAAALTGGLLAGLLGLALIPLLESVFDVMTDSRLMELASGDHPLLKELSLRAPGTYHHSVMISNLVEAAAENVGANPLLARVMALYHDIGKMNKPHYFVENQSGENRHDHLAPSMSAKVIMSHIKDGVDMARRYKLTGPVLDGITQHQGTGMLQYFYNKAVSDAAKKGEQVSPNDYRYPGPKPTTREAGILMIADSVEAAARALRNPSPAQIQSLVRRITAYKIGDGQLDECNLSLRDLAKMEEAFVRVLTLGFYHRRIEYPDQNRKQA